MPPTLRIVEEQALQLARSQRAKLAGRLLASLDPDERRLFPDPVDEAAFAAELKRRIEEGERDPSVWIPAEQIFARTAPRERSLSSPRRKGTR